MLLHKNRESPCHSHSENVYILLLYGWSMVVDSSHTCCLLCACVGK